MADSGHWTLILFKGQALVPTMARTAAGFYIGIEPVETVDARNRTAVEQALMRAIGRGNPSVPTPSRTDFPKNPLLKYVKLKSDSSFDKLSRSWKLSKHDGAYLIVPYRLRRDTGKEEDVEHGEAIPASAPLEEVVRRLVRRALESEDPITK
jgi:hypothetical protein